MRLIEFTPGEGSRFFVGVAVVTPRDAKPLGGDEDTLLITFGGEKTLKSATFQCNRGKYGYLSREYLAQYLSALDEASLIVAHHVVAALLGREAIGAPWTPEQLEWEPNWKDQLAPLFLEISNRRAIDRAICTVAHPLSGDALRWEEIGEAFAPDVYDCHFDEGQRQLLLLATHKLRQERPGFDYALSEIEKQLGGQMDWPTEAPTTTVKSEARHDH